MSRFEVEKFSLGDIEKEPKERRFALILEDSRPNQQMWLMAFADTPNLRCVVPKVSWGYTEELINKIDLSRVDLVIIDWFVDGWELHKETQVFLDRLREINSLAFVVETSASRPRRGEKAYKGSNISCCSFNLFMDQSLVVVRDNPDETMAGKLYALQKLLVSTLKEAQRLGSDEKISEDELVEDFVLLMREDATTLILDNLGISGEELEERFLALSYGEKRLLVHCGFSIAANVYMEKDEMFYTMPLFRMKQVLGLGD